MIKWLFLLLAVNAQHALAESHHPQSFLQSVQGKKDEARKIYKHFCANCHASQPLIPLGAPRIGTDVDWQFRIKQGLAVLFKHTDEGINAMPARGGCFECSDEQLVKTIIYMTPKEAQKALINELYDNKSNIKIK